MIPAFLLSLDGPLTLYLPYSFTCDLPLCLLGALPAALYMIDDDRIRALFLSNNTVATIAGNGIPGPNNGDNGPAVDAWLNNPMVSRERVGSAPDGRMPQMAAPKGVRQLTGCTHT